VAISLVGPQSHQPGATVLNEAQYQAQIAQPINQILGLVYRSPHQARPRPGGTEALN
jgi:hypothetical protein